MCDIGETNAERTAFFVVDDDIFTHPIGLCSAGGRNAGKLTNLNE